MADLNIRRSAWSEAQSRLWVRCTTKRRGVERVERVGRDVGQRETRDRRERQDERRKVGLTSALIRFVCRRSAIDLADERQAWFFSPPAFQDRPPPPDYVCCFFLFPCLSARPSFIISYLPKPHAIPPVPEACPSLLIAVSVGS